MSELGNCSLCKKPLRKYYCCCGGKKYLGCSDLSGCGYKKEID